MIITKHRIHPRHVRGGNERKEIVKQVLQKQKAQPWSALGVTEEPVRLFVE